MLNPDHNPRAAPSQSVNLFFALKPDADAAAKAFDFACRQRARHGLAGRPLAADRLHITLLSVGMGPGPPPGAVMTAASKVGDTVRRAAFEVSLNRVASFARPGGHRPCVLLGDDGVIDVMMLQRSLAGAMLKYQTDFRKPRRFTPHMTVLYDDLQVDEAAVAPIAWMAREFLLVESWVGLTKHIVRGRWPLPEFTAQDELRAVNHHLAGRG